MLSCDSIGFYRWVEVDVWCTATWITTIGLSSHNLLLLLFVFFFCAVCVPSFFRCVCVLFWMYGVCAICFCYQCYLILVEQCVVTNNNFGMGNEFALATRAKRCPIEKETLDTAERELWVHKHQTNNIHFVFYSHISAKLFPNAAHKIGL